MDHISYQVNIPTWALLLSAIPIAALSWVVLDYLRVLNLRRKLPPGPFPWPIVGNTFQLPDRKPWVWFDIVAKELNAPVITIWIGRNPTLWICDAWAADELLNKRANTYSSRPRMVVFGELGTGQNNLVTMRYGQRWRELRKITHHGVGTQQVRNYREVQNNESKQIPWEIMNDPAEYVNHFERYAASVVSVIGFGRRLQTFKDPLIPEVIYMMHLAAALNVPGKSFPMILETFPILARLPEFMAPWLRGSKGRQQGQKFFYALAQEAALESPNENICRDLWQEYKDSYKLTVPEIAGLAGNLFGAGSDTSSSTLITFVLACVAFPEVLPKAWEELDRVVGHDRSPTFEDQESLPYINAFVSEVFRWRSVAIIGGQPHANVEDDIWNGYFIPKNTWVQANIWAIHRQEKEFPDPDRFNPDRYLAENRLPYPDRKGYSTFGYGRRICAGQALAEAGTFISCARLLWSFNITKALDAKGNPIDVDIFNYTNGLNIRPQPFPARFIPRSDRIKAAIEREAKEALSDLDRYNIPTKYRLSEIGMAEHLKVAIK